VAPPAPLTGTRGASPVHVHGQNGLGDIDLDGFTHRPPLQASPMSGSSSWSAPIPGHHDRGDRPADQSGLGLRAAPDIADLVPEVVVMGGAFGEGGRGGNVTPFAEANIHNDPRPPPRCCPPAGPSS
jgi:purine nucleosidase